MPDEAGQLVIHEKLQRDLILSFLNPARLSDVQAIISLFSCCKTLLSEEDLVEVVWKKQNKFREQDFVLRNVADMSLEEMQFAVADAQPAIYEDEPMWGRRTPVWTLRTKEEILDEYRELVYVPVDVYQVVRGGQEVLSLFRLGAEERRRNLVDIDLAEGYLEMACESGLDTEVIEDLWLEAQVYHPGVCFVENTDAVNLAAAGGHVEALRFLIDRSDESVLHQADEEGLTALLAAAERGQLEMVSFLIAQGVDTNAMDANGAGLFIKACSSSDIHFVRHLLDGNFDLDLDVTATDYDGNTAVHYVAEMGDIPMIKFLVDELEVPFSRGPVLNRTVIAQDPAWEATGSPLRCAALGGSIEMLDYLVEELNLDPLELDSKGANLIFDAAMGGCDRLVDHLIRKYSLDPSALDEDGCMALFDSASEGHWHTIKNLVDKHGVDVHHTNAFGQNVLFAAATAGDEILYHRLVGTYGLDTGLTDTVHNTAEDYFPPSDSDGTSQTTTESGSSWETDSGGAE